MPSGQQYQPTLGQPPWQAGFSWQQMGSQQQWQHSTCHQGSSTSQHWGSRLGKLGFLGNKWAVSSSGSTVHAIRAAVPANIGAAASRAFCSIALLRGSHLGKLGLLCNKWAVSSSG